VRSDSPQNSTDGFSKKGVFRSKDLAFVGSVRLDDRNRPIWLVATSVLTAASGRLKGVGARYFEDCHHPSQVSEPELYGGDVIAWASDPGIARRLRDVAAE